MKETKIAAVMLTDTHLFEKRTKKDSIIDCNFDEVKKAFEKSIELAKEHNLKRIFHLGDFFDSRKHQSQNLLEMAYNILESFRKAQIDLVLITGNHDKTDYSNDFSFISAFKDHPNLVLVENYNFYDDEENKIRYHCIAYFENDIYKTFLDASKTQLHNSYRNILLTHIGISGVLKNDGEKEESSLTMRMFEEFDKVYLGHFHQASSHIKNKINYIGSAIPHNFGEDNNKGVILLDSNLNMNRIKTQFKEYITIHVDAEDVTQEDIDDLITQNNEIHQRVVFTGDENLIKALDKSKLINNGIKYQVKADVIEIQKVEQRIEAHSNESIFENFTEYCKENEYQEEDGLVYLKKVI